MGHQVALCIGHHGLRRAVRGFVAGLIPGASIVEAPDHEKLMALAEAHALDLLLVDLLDRTWDAVRLLREMDAKAPKVGRICLCAFADQVFADHAFAVGANAFVVSYELVSELPVALASLGRGSRYLSPSVVPQLATSTAAAQQSGSGGRSMARHPF